MDAEEKAGAADCLGILLPNDRASEVNKITVAGDDNSTDSNDSNDSNNTGVAGGESDSGLSLPSWLQVLLLAMLASAALALAASVVLLYRRTEPAHPLYAVLLQDMAFLTCAAWATATSMLLSLVLPCEPQRARAAMVTMNILPSVIQFHQISWLVIIGLRQKPISESSSE